MKNAATIRNDNLKNDVLEKVEDNKTFHFDFGKGKQFPTFNSNSWSSVKISTGISILRKYYIMNIPQFFSTKRNFST